MAKYKVLATTRGLNYNNEFISDTAIASFTNAFKAGHKSNYTHKEDIKNYVPQIGTVIDTSVENNDGYAVIDYVDDFSERLANGEVFDVSIYAKCKSHFDDKGVRQIEELLYDENNSIDVVKCGAVPSARVLERIADNNNEFVTSWIKCSFEPISDDIVSPKGEKGDKMLTEDDIKKIANETATATTTAILNALKTVAQEKTDEPTDEEEANKQEEITNQLTNAYLAGLNSKDLPQVMTDEIANAIRLGDDVNSIVENRKKIVDEIKNNLVSETAPISNGIKRYSNDEEASDNVFAVAFSKGGNNG